MCPTPDLKDEWSKPKFFFGDVGQISAIDSATHSHDAIEVFALPFLLDLLDGFLKLVPAALIGVPVWSNVFVETVAMIANALLIKRDHGIGCIHDAVGANLIFSSHYLIESLLRWWFGKILF